MQLAERIELAKLYSLSTFLPDELRNSPANCLVMMDLGDSIGEGFWRVVHGVKPYRGKPAASAEFMIGRAMQSGLFMGCFEYEEFDDGKGNFGCRVLARGTDGKDYVGPVVDMAMARAEQWTRNNKYNNIPMAKHMLRLRAATFFIRLHCPQVTFGGMTLEEAEDVAASELRPSNLGPVAPPVVVSAKPTEDSGLDLDQRPPVKAILMDRAPGTKKAKAKPKPKPVKAAGDEKA